ncbi:MAG: cytochrome c-type biogenesis protein CcmH [Gammaproteobacteria bacterium]|nr:cytochrome c-type biogenesis protein CcmH [Gammaproteobacteria bacterium]
MKLKQITIIFVLSFWTVIVQAGIYAFEFDDPAKEQRFKQLSEELRCLVCQNQTLADSNAGLAMDLRKELYKQVLSDASDEEIKNFMVSRYGDFVLYKPPVRTSTYLLWFGPFILVAIALIILLRVIRSSNKQTPTTLSDADHKRAQQLLSENKD